VRLVRSLSRERCPPNIYIFSGLKHARLLAPDGLELAMTGCSGAVIFGHLKALALDHLGGQLDHNDVAVFMWLPPFRAAFSAPGRDGEANRPRCSPRYQSSNPLCLVIGFFAGYATRAYMSYLRRRSKN
jgi:hypothetical protein